jgi:hypothetical protein
MAQARQLKAVNGLSHPSSSPRPGSRQTLGTHLVIGVVLAAVAVTAAASGASAQTCLRPKWTECVQFPNGGRHTGVSPQGTAVQTEVASGPEICVGNEEEIGAQTYAQFWRNGVPWPDRDWEVNADTFCFYKN